MLYKTITVTVKQTYVVPVGDKEPKDGHTQINDWSLKEVAEDWFQHHDINQHHASRHAHHALGGDKIVGIELDEKAKSGRDLRLFEM